MKCHDPARQQPAPRPLHAHLTQPSPTIRPPRDHAFRRPQVAPLATVLLAAAVPHVALADNPPAFADSTHAPMVRSSGAVSLDATASVLATERPSAAADTTASSNASDARAQPQPSPVMDALRARLTGGAVFFGDSTLVRDETAGTALYDSSEFSSASPYLAFEAQPRLWPIADPSTADSYRRVYFEGIANMRLTAIGATGAGVGDAGIVRPDASALKSQKSAQLQLGALLSFNGRGFDVLGTRFHWGLGPVYRMMFQTVTDAQRNRRVWNAEDDIYDAHTAGLRLSLYSRPDDSSASQASQGWAPTAYIDFTGGLFQNFAR